MLLYAFMHICIAIAPTRVTQVAVNAITQKLLLLFWAHHTHSVKGFRG